MVSRCENTNNKQYKDYGGRGITVCDRWRQRQIGFNMFIEDMGERPEGMTLDRIDNEKGYALDNCKWSTRKEQNNNQRVREDNKTGYKGVRFIQRLNKYVVDVTLAGVRCEAAYFSDLNSAVDLKQKIEEIKSVSERAAAMFIKDIVIKEMKLRSEFQKGNTRRAFDSLCS